MLPLVHWSALIVDIAHACSHLIKSAVKFQDYVNRIVLFTSSQNNCIITFKYKTAEEKILSKSLFSLAFVHSDVYQSMNQGLIIKNTSVIK